MLQGELIEFNNLLAEVASYFTGAAAFLCLFIFLQTLAIFWLLRKVAALRLQKEQYAQARRTATFLKALIAHAPDPWIIWRHDTGGITASPSLAERLPSLGAGPTTMARLIKIIKAQTPDFDERALEPLSQGQASIECMVSLGPEELLKLIGQSLRKEGYNASILWLKQVTPAPEGLTAPVYEALLDALPYPVWLRGNEGRLAYCNKAYAEALRTSRDQIIQENKFPWKEDEIKVCEQEADDVEITPPPSSKPPALVKDMRHLFECHEAIIPTEGYRAGYTTGFSQHLDLQADLERHIAAHRFVLEQLSAGLIIFGDDKRVKFFNSAYVRLFDMDEGWLHNQPLLSEVLENLRSRRLIAEQADFSAYKKRLQGMFAGLRSPLQELMHLPDERTIRFITSPHPLGGLFFLCEDVTDSLILERQTNTQMAVLKETLDHLYEAVAVFTSDNRLKLSNPAFARLWRLPKELLASGCPIADVVEGMQDYFEAGDNWDTYKLGIIEHLTDRIPKSGRLKRADDSVLEFSYVPLPDGAHFVSYTNVTDSYRVERALRERNQALETADQLKTEFIDNMSHELKAPLNTIIGFTEILTNHYLGGLNSQQKAYAKGIFEASHHLLSLVNDMIDLATIEAGYMALNLKEVDIKALLTSVVSLVRKRARSQRLKLILNCASDMPLVVADERRLKQAVFNLLNNAFKFTAPEGRITLAATCNEQTLILSVSDSGAGMMSTVQEPIFKVFDKKEDATERTIAGNLGLSLVKSLIELHGGKVAVEVKSKRGAKVVCYLPLGLLQSPQTDLLKIA